MAKKKLPPITRDPNSTIPDYEANVDTLFNEMVKINDRLTRAFTLLENNPMKAPEGTGDYRDFQTMALLLPEGGDPSWEQQILQMRDDFYSRDSARKKPWLDIMYDRYDNVDVAKLDPAKPEEARMILESTALAQTFPVKLNENFDYKKERYKTAQAQNIMEKRNEYALPFESMAQFAVAKAYDANGKKVSENDPLPDAFTAHELKISGYASCYKMKTEMTTISTGMDSRFFYPSAQRVIAENQLNKTGKIEPLELTLPQEFSAFAGKNIEDINPQEIMSGTLSFMAKNYVREMFRGQNSLNEISDYTKRVFINGKSAADLVAEKFPELKSYERIEVIPVVIAAAMASGKDKISTVFTVKNDKGLYQACPIEVKSDLTAVYSSPQALNEAKQRQAQANSRPLTQQEQDSYDRGLKEANRGIFNFSIQKKKNDFEEDYALDGSGAKKTQAMKEFSRQFKEQDAKDKLFIKNEISAFKIQSYDKTGIAEPLDYRLDHYSIPESYRGRSIDDLTLKNCKTKDYDSLLLTVNSFNIGEMNAQDVVLIDGKTVSTQVSERYPTVTDPIEQGRLGKAMLGIALANGKHRLTTINTVETGVPGVSQIQEKPINLNVTGMYPTKEDEFNWFHRTFLDWGPLKCVTKGEIAQKEHDKLMATPLTGAQEEIKVMALQDLNRNVIRKTSEKVLKNYNSPEYNEIQSAKINALRKFEAEKDAIIKNKLEAWTKDVLAPEQPKKEIQASAQIAISMDKVDKIDKEIQVKQQPLAQAKQEPAKEAPEQEPAKEAPKQEPAKEAPKQEPAKEAPKQEPAKEAPKQAPKPEAKQEKKSEEKKPEAKPNAKPKPKKKKIHIF